MLINIRMEAPQGTPLAAQRNAALTHFVHALETSLRRKAAGTVMPGSCRPIEVTWRRQALSRVMMSAENIEEAANLVGFDSFMEGASMSMSALCELLPDSHGTMRAIVVAHEPLFWEVMASACDIIMLRGWNVDTLVSNEQAGLVDKMFLLADSKTAMTAGIEGLQRWLNAWNRLRHCKGAIIDRFVKNVKDERAMHLAAYQRTIAAAASAPGLRYCALAGCDSREQHPAHFKACAACKAVVYCSKEHQVQDWSAHKTACKAARKAAADSGSSGPSGA